MITHSYAYLFIHSRSSEWSHTACRLEAGRNSLTSRDSACLASISFLTMCLVIRDLYLHRAVYMHYSRQCSSFNNFRITSFVIKHILEYVSGNYGYWAGLGWTNLGWMCSWANCPVSELLGKIFPADQLAPMHNLQCIWFFLKRLHHKKGHPKKRKTCITQSANQNWEPAHLWHSATISSSSWSP